MNWTSERILRVLDASAEQFTFPVLDNGYVYLAATRMSVYRSDGDWAIVIRSFWVLSTIGKSRCSNLYIFQQITR